tara:strand:+ start:127 stop:357 length:231 start_codon:yes stop_codon:yes gene_type:complete
MSEKDLFLNEDEPHLKQTILPPNDLSDTRSELPQFKQILLELISNSKINSSYLNYIRINNVKKKVKIINDIENLLQ